MIVDGAPTPDHVLGHLDADQRAAVTTPSTLVAVIAAAGSGKTRVLTRRIAHRIDIDTAEARFTLALTFTREAAGELRRRLRRLGLREPVEAGTFHAIALGLLRQRWRDTDRPEATIVNDRTRLLREVAEGMPVATLSTEADWSAAQQVAARDYVAAAARAHRRSATPPAAIAAALERYDTTKRRRGVIDLDDLLPLLSAEIARDPTYAEVVRFRYRHLLVDEAQDLNPAQFRLLQLLDGGRNDLFLVGDPAQAIYGFNGADPELLAGIDEHLPGIEIVRLPVNHRCLAPIVAAGQHVLRAGGQPGESVSARGEGEPVEIHGAPDADGEAALVARLVYGLDPSLVRTGQVGVLARTNAQLPAMEAALGAAGVPVRRRAVPAGSPLAATVRAATSLQSAARLRAWAHDVLDGPPTEAQSEPRPIGRPFESHESAERRTAAAVLDFLREQPLGDGAALRTWIATSNPFAREGDLDGVDVLTFHAAKGREWHTVVVTGAETGLVPIRSAATVAARAEEARLLHVAVTRASDRLIVTSAVRRHGYARKLSPLLAGLAADAATDGDARAAGPAALPRRPRQPAPRDRRRQRLDRWRADAARAANVLPTSICADADLDTIAASDPATAAALADVTSMGPLTAQRLFDTLRAALDAP